MPNRIHLVGEKPCTTWGNLDFQSTLHPRVVSTTSKYVHNHRQFSAMPTLYIHSLSSTYIQLSTLSMRIVIRSFHKAYNNNDNHTTVIERSS